MTTLDRRSFLRRGVATAVGGALLGGPFQGLVAAAAKADGSGATAISGGRPGYGPLGPVPDLRDGVVRLHLPRGFKYRSFDPAGATMSDGYLVPQRHDGMAAFDASSGLVRLIRNHEINGPLPAIGDVSRAYDPMAGSGTTTVLVSKFGEVVRNEISLNGTQMNCAGGPMPWGSWVSCEETVNGPDVGNDFTGGDNDLLHEKHGYIFEVPPEPVFTATPIRSAGRFAHEALSIDPATGHLYLTEDNFNFASGLYRYIAPQNPMEIRQILDGGMLQMLKVIGEDNADLSLGQETGATYPVEWVDIPDPDPEFVGEPTNDEAIQAVGNQGREQGAALFSRLEGITYDNGTIYVVSTQGGATAPGDTPPDGFGDGRGQVWAYDPAAELITMIYESPGSTVLDLPDNVTRSKRGSLVLCEDFTSDNYVRGLTLDGELFDFALNRIPGQEGDEFAGSTFSPNFQTLFVNNQSSNSMTFAIWGPWGRGGF
jgi:uncharacterized protein